MISSFRRSESIQAANIIAFLKGSDKKEECVVVSAHYDHLGIEGGEIYNGAYDNAAGVAAVLAVARAFSEAAAEGIRPKRNVVFYLCDAEELGGVGSMFFLDNPPFSLNYITADLNIDGIGREDESRPRLKDFVHFYMSRAGRDKLREIRDEAAVASPKLRLVHRESYGGSDHAFFERAGIPVIALSTGHPKDHHKPTDTADKLDYLNIRDIARLAFACAWLIADDDQMIERAVVR
jgi:Zn-dependent M28 family amino/carboxypeptidase